jgi:hypothetical protein
MPTSGGQDTGFVDCDLQFYSGALGRRRRRPFACEGRWLTLLLLLLLPLCTFTVAAAARHFVPCDVPSRGGGDGGDGGSARNSLAARETFGFGEGREQKKTAVDAALQAAWPACPPAVGPACFDRR